MYFYESTFIYMVRGGTSDATEIKSTVFILIYKVIGFEFILMYILQSRAQGNKFFRCLAPFQNLISLGVFVLQSRMKINIPSQKAIFYQKGDDWEALELASRYAG